MVVIVKDVSWLENVQKLTVKVPIKNAIKPDVVISERYIKASYGKYFFEAVLLNSIKDKCSKCRVTDDEIIFDLVKAEGELWKKLEVDMPKTEKMKFKLKLIEDYYKRVKQDDDDLKKKKSELKKFAVKKQIECDADVRNKIETVKKNEEINAMGDVDKFKLSLKETPKEDITKFDFPIRKTSCAVVDFTPRIFPTPSRESKLEEENEWLRRQAEARRSCGFASEDVRPEERNPQFLKTKGEEFLKNKNYLAAISVFSYGLKISPKFVDFYIARSQAHFQLGNFYKVVKDCSDAIDLLKPVCAGNLKERALCIGRRGMALCKLGMKKQGKDELGHSLNLIENEEFDEFFDSIEDD